MKNLSRRSFSLVLSFVILVLSFVCVPRTALAYASTVSLSNPSVLQPKTNWCWAACGTSCTVFLSYNFITPYDFSMAVKGNSTNNSTASLSEVRYGLNSFSITSTIGSILTFQNIMYENDTKERPIIAGICYMNQYGAYVLGHLLVISGYQNLSTGGKVWIMDPYYGNKTWLTYSALCNYNSWYWTSSIYNMNYTGN